MPTVTFLTDLPRRLLVALILLTGMQSQALTLGRVQGAALIGRPLAVTVQVQLEPNQSITSACFEADVFHADTRQNPAGVTVRLEPSAAPQTAILHITSQSRIDEPIVTIYVRAGCAQMSSRRYVLLADIVSEQAAQPAARVATVPLVDPSTSTASSTSQSPSSTLTASGAAGLPSATAAATAPAARPPSRTTPRSTTQRRSAPDAARRANRAEPKRQAPARTAAPAGGAGVAAADSQANRSTGQSRLRLDPLEMLSERVATLESQATTAPTQLSEREVAEAARLDRLEASVAALLALAAKNEASLLDVRGRLEKAQADRFSSTVIYILFALLLLCLLAIAYLLTRMSRRPGGESGRWYDASRTPDPDSLPAEPVARSAPAPLAQAAAVPAAVPTSAPTPLSSPASMQQTYRLPNAPAQPMPDVGVRDAGSGNPQVDVSLVEMSESTFDRLMQSGAAQNAVRHARDTVPMATVRSSSPPDAGAPAVPPPRINADELIDIRQRAEFFVTLGQTDQAVQVLEARIAQDGASCPQAYLDLLKLFHSLGLKADFTQVSEDFTLLFNTRVPDFADFENEGRSLEEYPGAVDRLIAAWRRPIIIDTLEQMLFRSQLDAAAVDAFDLAAFRDLLLLHAVAQSIHAVTGGQRGSARAPGRGTDVAGPSVDIDLSELFSQDGAPTVVMARAADAVSSVADTGPGADALPSGNLIDFDLNDVDFIRKPDKGH